MQARPFATPPRNPFARGAYIMARRYIRHQVGMRSAALAFYLLFAIFPILIFVSALVDCYRPISSRSCRVWAISSQIPLS